jgi:PKHD-type hydroxylase
MEHRMFYPAEQEMIPDMIFTEQFLSPEECEYISKYMLEQPLDFATIGNGGNDTFHQNLQYRTVRSGYLSDSEFGWVYERLRNELVKINRDFFRFDLTGLLEAIQFLSYDTGSDDIPDGHYDWHQDYGGGYSSLRKISCIVQLSDPTTYDGCALNTFTNCQKEVPNKKQGMLSSFPSYLPHMVTPISRGRRNALVTWVSGPRFR